MKHKILLSVALILLSISGFLYRMIEVVETPYLITPIAVIGFIAFLYGRRVIHNISKIADVKPKGWLAQVSLSFIFMAVGYFGALFLVH